MLTRFAPSPTGFLHLGNARTALFNYLAAKNAGGEMLLRIEDTDDARNKETYIAAVDEDLAWLGLEWNRDKVQRQTQQFAEYQQFFDGLRRRGRVYPCFCTSEELTARRQQQLAAGKPPRYDGKCANLAEETAQTRLNAGEAAAWRFRLPKGDLSFDDLVRGRLSFAAAALGDFVIRRANQAFTFLFANVADDILSGVTHVLRGDDHTANTPRQIALAAAMELPPPRYGHIPLMVDDGGRPLSKRDGLTPIRHWRELGFLPLAVVNYLARIGHHYPPPDDKPLLPAATLASLFSMTRIGRAAARHDAGQLLRRQQEAAQGLSDEDLRAWLGGELLAGVRDATEFCQLVRDNISLPQDAAVWRDLLSDGAQLSELSEQLPPLAAATGDFYRAAAEISETADWADFIEKMRAATGKKGKELLLPIRTALTGRKDGPAIEKLFGYLSPNERRRRFLTAAAAAAASQADSAVT